MMAESKKEEVNDKGIDRRTFIKTTGIGDRGGPFGGISFCSPS